MPPLSCPSDLPPRQVSPCLRLEVARYPAKADAPGLLARIAGCGLCGRSLAITSTPVSPPVVGAAPCPYMAHPSVAGRMPVATIEPGAVDF
jgi:hypothetical protein